MFAIKDVDREFCESKPHVQLQMIWPEDRIARPPEAIVPASYELRTFRSGDEEGYKRLMERAGFPNWGDTNLKQTLATSLPGGIFFAAERVSGALAATAAAQHSPTEMHPFGGALGWVASDPDHRGRGLGTAVCACVVKRLLDAGYSDIHLLTDDFRLAAIKIYLKQGWMPFLFADDMKERWRVIGEQIKAC